MATPRPQIFVSRADTITSRGMQRAVPQVRLRREIERLRHPLQPGERVGQHRRTVLPERNIERLAGGQRADNERMATFDAGVDHPRERRVFGQLADERAQIFGDEPRPFGANLQLEMLDGDSLAGVGVFATKDGTQSAGPNLVQHTKAAKRSGRRRNVSGRAFPGHGSR